MEKKFNDFEERLKKLENRKTNDIANGINSLIDTINAGTVSTGDLTTNTVINNLRTAVNNIIPTVNKILTNLKGQ